MSVRVFALVLFLVATPLLAQTKADALLSIDEHRGTVIDRIMREAGDAVVRANAEFDAAQLRDMLNGLRADQLLAASLAGTGEGLRDVLAKAMLSADGAVSRALVPTKALGDTAADVTYTPVTPCRLIDTRGLFSPVYAGGAFATNEVRTYT